MAAPLDLPCRESPSAFHVGLIRPIWASWFCLAARRPCPPCSGSLAARPSGQRRCRYRAASRRAHRLASAFLVQIKPVIAAVHESLVGRYCCKSRKSDDTENLAKVDFLTSLSLQGSTGRYEGSWSILRGTMWSLMLPRTKRISGPKNFRSSDEKDLFNTICQKRNSGGGGYWGRSRGHW